MERDARRLLLDEQAGGAGGERPDLGNRGFERRGDRQRPRASVGEAELEPVRARDGDGEPAEMALEIDDRPAADDRHAAAEPVGQTLEQRMEVARHSDRVGRLGELD